MENYRRYRLKSESELLPLLCDGTLILVCGKCFREFDAAENADLSALTHLAEKENCRIAGCLSADFLCSKHQTAKKLSSLLPPETKAILVAACGLGIQTVSDLTHLPVYAAADSVGEEGHGGMALSDVKCGGCGQCFLNLTGGICPVTDCAKSLLNGQCGGAKNGKCEVYPEKDCAWENIHEKLEKQGRNKEFLSSKVILRDHAKASLATVRSYVNAIRAEKEACGYGGVHPLGGKEKTSRLASIPFPVPSEVVIPLQQHIGAPATPLVQAGDYVKLGQKIGEGVGFVSANIHASLSGTVTAVEERPHATLGSCLSVVIRSDGMDLLHESVAGTAEPFSLSPAAIVDIIREKGVVGMGGAAFPTAAKLSTDKKVDTVLLNGCECESLLTADHRLMVENPAKIIAGLKLMMKAANAEKGIIAIEDNKPDAIACMEKETQNDPALSVSVLQTRYPYGAEKVLIRRVLNREVPKGGLPADAGVLVSNVSTAKAVADAVMDGMPPIERIVTLSGEKIRQGGNFTLRIGTPMKALLEYCGVEEGAEIKVGGGMMGVPLTDTSAPVVKATGGIIAVESLPRSAAECIRCGRCVDACPMELFPLYFAKYAKEENRAGLKEENITDCIECGCCQYICPSSIPLVTWIKRGKKALREMK